MGFSTPLLIKSTASELIKGLLHKPGETNSALHYIIQTTTMKLFISTFVVFSLAIYCVLSQRGAFEAFDENGDGCISQDELKAKIDKAMNWLGIKSDVGDFEEIWNAIDCDSDRCISPEELRIAMNGQECQPRRGKRHTPLWCKWLIIYIKWLLWLIWKLIQII